jgi:hypothetical protein
MTKWEYRVLSLDETVAPSPGHGFQIRLSMALRGFGEDGWELAGLVDGEASDVFVCLKRPM